MAGGRVIGTDDDALAFQSAFADRPDAGRQLASRLESYRGADLLVLGLPRGGVVVAVEVARSLGAELDVVVVRKIGAPRQPELALGAVATDGTVRINRALVRELGIPRWLMRVLADDQRAEARRRERNLRGERPPPRIEGRTVILVDDGLATGATMRAAVRSVRKAVPARVVVAVPVGAPSTCQTLRGEADDVVCLVEADPFFAVGLHYARFDPVSDEEVGRWLATEEP